MCVGECVCVCVQVSESLDLAVSVCICLCVYVRVCVYMCVCEFAHGCTSWCAVTAPSVLIQTFKHLTSRFILAPFNTPSPPLSLSASHPLSLYPAPPFCRSPSFPLPLPPSLSLNRSPSLPLAISPSLRSLLPFCSSVCSKRRCR